MGGAGAPPSSTSSVRSVFSSMSENLDMLADSLTDVPKVVCVGLLSRSCEVCAVACVVLLCVCVCVCVCVRDGRLSSL